MADVTINPWKMVSIGLVLVGATVLVTSFVAGQRNATDTQQGAKNKAPIEQHRRVQAHVTECNQYAANQSSDKTTEVLKDAAIGGLGGAGVGAAGGAIADGGSGAGKGAAIGGIAGAVGGVLYGMNENKQQDEQYRKAYASCMRKNGYS